MALIDNYDEHNPMLRHSVSGYDFAFSVSGFPKDRHEWLCGVIGRQLDRIYELGYISGKVEVQDGIKKALGLR